jgi:hypothetical protein
VKFLTLRIWHCLNIFVSQLLFGKLNLPIEALRVIEESSATPDDLQMNLGYVDECGNPSKFLNDYRSSQNSFTLFDHWKLLPTSAPGQWKFTIAAKRKRQS